MNYKVKTRKVTAPRNVKNSEQLKKRKITENADIDVSPKKKPNKLAKSQKEEDNNLVEDESLSEDGQWQSSVERSALVENLKSIIKACGMSILPVIYKKAKQAIDDKRETIVVKELEGILSREGLSKIPAEKDVLWPITMRSREQMESGPYPVREGELDCSYYIRTGVCRFGPTCRFNHPPNRKLAIATAMMKGEYPERIGQPECENEIECAYYIRNGQCKFGSTCKFHHPQPLNMMVSLRGSAVYSAIHSPTTNPLSYPLSRGSFIASPRWQSPSSYTPLVMQQGVVSIPGWNIYSGQPSSALSSENQPPSAVNIQNDGASHQGDSGNIASEDGSVPMGYYAFQKDNVFPERPGQSECQFYMKTGDCKFGAVCKFHHPKERLIPVPDCHLSPIGLPLRPGEPVCVFYSRYGICKFGPSCKFDHPMRVFAYNTPASSSTDFAAIHRFLASSPGTVPANFSSDGLMDGSYTNNRRLSLSEARQKPSGDNNADSE